MENYWLNAKIHHLPACPECDAEREQPCVTERGAVRSPHNVRVKIAAGEITVKATKKKDARAGLNQVEVRVLRKGLKRAVDKAVERVRGNWGIKTRSNG